MSKFEVLLSITDIKKFSEVIFDILKDKNTPDEISNLLSEELSENGLQTIQSIARSDYPLSLERRQ